MSQEVCRLCADAAFVCMTCLDGVVVACGVQDPLCEGAGAASLFAFVSSSVRATAMCGFELWPPVHCGITVLPDWPNHHLNACVQHDIKLGWRCIHAVGSGSAGLGVQCWEGGA